MRISDWSSDVCSSDLRAHPAERQVHAAECGLALDETEGLRNGEFEGEPKQFVEHAGARLARIILDRDEAEIAAIARPRWTEFDRLLPEADPAVGQIGADVLRRQQQGTAFAMEGRREETHG